MEPLHSLLCSGMRDKKVHEVQRLSTLINSLCEEHNTSNVLDLGAGQGYLDYILSHVYGRTVIGVDDDTLQTCGAIRRTDKIKKVALKQGHASGHCFHINKRITAQETFASLLSQVLEETQLDSLPSTSQDWILCGLHTCGDLAPASIKHFLESDARVLVNVGCCYNRLSESDPEQPSNATPGFPMSGMFFHFVHLHQ